jgi:hypothetical protein
MRTTRVKKDELLEIVKHNRDRHKDVVAEAMRNYRKAAVKQLELMLADAKAGRRIHRSLTLIQPMDMTREYDQIIRQLQMEVADTVELSEGEFAQYVLNRWNLGEQFATSTRMYTKSIDATAYLNQMEPDESDE